VFWFSLVYVQSPDNRQPTTDNRQQSVRYDSPSMKVLHLAAGNRWTGAAAPAFAEVEALRAAGVDAHYAYVGGYKLEAKIRRFDFAHPLIAKAQNPYSFLRSVRALEHLFDHHRFDVIHAHLTYDHWLARFAVRGSTTRIARTFHARRVLRNDPFTRSLIANSDAIFVINDTFADAPPVRSRRVTFTPPPIDQRQFDPDGTTARAQYGIADGVSLIAAIGKLSKDRGFEAVLETFAIARRSIAAKLMIIGHGEHRPALEAHASALGITSDVIWAGYHEDDLAEHYRAADLLLFTARGSDEGHRAVLEAMSCATIPAVYPIPGLAALLGDLNSECMATQESPESLAALVVRMLTRNDLAPLRRLVRDRSDHFAYEPSAERLMRVYERIVTSPRFEFLERPRP
jgi:glycosyltransferase involved in cell wall biosynthesis